MYPYEGTLLLSENLFGITPFAFIVYLFSGNQPVLMTNLLSFFLLLTLSFSTFVITKKLFNSNLGSFVSALIMLLNPWLLKMFSLQRFHMLFLIWIPLLIYYTKNFFDKGEAKYLLLYYIFYLWTFLGCMYIGIFFEVFIVIWVVFWIIYEKNIFKKTFLFLSTHFLVWFSMLFIFLKYKNIGESFGIIRNISDQEAYTGPLYSIFTVPDENFLWGNIIHILPKGTRDGIIENFLFPGATVIILSVIMFFVRKIPSWMKSLRVAGLFMLLFSIGPFLNINSYKIPLPFYFLYYLFPPLKATRNPHRFFIFFILVVSFFSAYIVKKFFNTKLNKKTKILIYFLAISFLFIETFTSGNAGVAISNSDITFYSKIIKKYKPNIVLELPINIRNDLKAMSFSTYQWYKLVNGVSGIRPPLQIQLERELSNFPDSKSIRILENLGVDTLIVNTNWYRRKNRLVNSKKSYSYLKAHIKKYKDIKIAGYFKNKIIFKLKNTKKLKILDLKKDVVIKLRKYKKNSNISYYLLNVDFTKNGNNFIFNPYAPSTFKFTPSKKWEIVVKNSKNEIIFSTFFEPKALLYGKYLIYSFKFNSDTEPSVITISIFGKFKIVKKVN